MFAASPTWSHLTRSHSSTGLLLHPHDLFWLEHRFTHVSCVSHLVSPSTRFLCLTHNFIWVDHFPYDCCVLTWSHLTRAPSSTCLLCLPHDLICVEHLLPHVFCASHMDPSDQSTIFYMFAQFTTWLATYWKQVFFFFNNAFLLTAVP